MAHILVNFRLDEDIKKKMEQACKDMGMSMTTAFTIFATRVAREKRIPFDVTADSHTSVSYAHQDRKAGADPSPAEEELMIEQRREQLETLCAEIRRSLTAIHTAIPVSITGLSMERIRLLCGDALKDKAAGLSSASRALFSGRNAAALKEKDLGLLDEYIASLSLLNEDLKGVEHTLVPAMRSWAGGETGVFEMYEQKLGAISKEFDGLQPLLQRFLHSTAQKRGSARAVRARIQSAAGPVSSAEVRSALTDLESLVLQDYDALDHRTKEQLENFYLQTLELTLQELTQAEKSGEDTGTKTALCLRTVNVLYRVIQDGRRTRRELSERQLEAEIVALERIAAMRGDIADTIGPDYG